MNQNSIDFIDDEKDCSNHLTETRACAACKYQRRKCKVNCIFSPFFPPDRPNDFHNIRRVFGVKNFARTLSKVEPSKRVISAKCMIREANSRIRDPAGGCYRIIKRYEEQIDRLESELELLNRQLADYRKRDCFVSTAMSFGLIDSSSSPNLRLQNNGSSIRFDLGNFDDCRRIVKTEASSWLQGYQYRMDQ